MSKTSWESSASWYAKIVGAKGHYYHTHVIFPMIEKILHFTKSSKTRYLDLACGQGVFSRLLPKNTHYTGVDISASLIQEAKKHKTLCKTAFTQADITKPLPLEESSYDVVLCILALQNVKECEAVFLNASKHIKDNGKFLIVLNHPCFRIPRHTHWHDNAKTNIRSRLIDHYLTPLEIPILTHPGQGGKSPKTWSYHYSISHYINLLSQSGFYTNGMHELCSDKKSEGGAARRENYARTQFPLFLLIEAENKPLVSTPNSA